MQSITIKEIPSIASSILSKAKDSNSSTATIITLSGDLGSGKTTLTQEIARQLGVKENVISPTFVILKNYELPITNYEWRRLVHIDAYRLDKDEELLKLGWAEILEDKNNLVIIEWAENVSECIPEKVCKVKLSHEDEGTRVIEF
jgi:tRNA threonylcarbamoyladenosine biosynthesis protein TsaE